MDECNDKLACSLYHWLPTANNPPAEILDLQAVSLDQLQNNLMTCLNLSWIHSFNPIQTQSFPSLFEHSDNVYVGAATGNQKIVCGELALCRELQNPNARCVYVAAIPEICNGNIEWKDMFGEVLSVVQLTGETSTTYLLKQGHIIISTVRIGTKCLVDGSNEKVFKIYP